MKKTNDFQQFMAEIAAPVVGNLAEHPEYGQGKVVAATGSLRTVAFEFLEEKPFGEYTADELIELGLDRWRDYSLLAIGIVRSSERTIPAHALQDLGPARGLSSNLGPVGRCILIQANREDEDG